jgi:nitrite reductase/ring-hydroxylating ferredoxin subunit
VASEYTVARVDEVPEGTHKVIQAAGREIGIFNISGCYYALPNHCFHQNGPLCRGSVSGTIESTEESSWRPTWVREGEVIVCPWHTLEFDIKTGRCLAAPRHRLPTYQVEVVGSEIKLTLP